MTPRILAVDDDHGIRSAMRLALEDEGFGVVEAATGEAALELFSVGEREPDVVLVDVVLPGIDGFEVCRRIRRDSDVPVIIVTARGETDDVITGLEAGADDYVSKPFVATELAARIRALLRRARAGRGGPGEEVRFGDLTLVPEAGELARDGRVVHLTKTEFRLLCELAANRGKVLSREQLLDRVWGYGYFGDGRLVDVHVRRLRAKIEPDPSRPVHVVTVRGLGYKLAL